MVYDTSRHWPRAAVELMEEAASWWLDCATLPDDPQRRVEKVLLYARNQLVATVDVADGTMVWPTPGRPVVKAPLLDLPAIAYQDCWLTYPSTEPVEPADWWNR